MYVLYTVVMKQSLSYFWAILASMTWGLTYALDEKVLRTSSPLHLAIVNACVTLLLFVPIAFFQNGALIDELVHAKNFPLMLLSSALVSLAGLFILYGIKELGASTASIIEISYPFFVMFFTMLLWRERLTPGFFLGGALMLLGSIVVIRSRG